MVEIKETGSKYAGIVWIISSLSFVTYATLMLTNQNVPGVEQLVDFLSTVDSRYIYGAAFLSILIEGLYLVGSFFPGSSLIIVLTIISQTGGIATYLTTVLVVFVGWCLAGGVNILLAKLYGVKILKQENNLEYEIKDRFLVTWFPAFRANYEVAQVTEGGNPYKVFWSSVKVKFFASMCMLAGMALVPLFVDINEVNNEEGATSLLVVAAISFAVGVVKLRKAWGK